MKTSIATLFRLLALLVGLGLMLAGQVMAQTLTTLHSFTGREGNYPHAALILSGNTLYGTTEAGGTSAKGTVFAINTNGSGFTTLYDFTGSSDGAYPAARLVLSDNTLYGTTQGTIVNGRSSTVGTVFAVNTDGSGFTTLYVFSGSDGANPYAGLALSGNTLYGTTVHGGSFDWGTVFAVNTDGSDFRTLHDFTAEDGVAGGNSDGTRPYAGLIASSNNLYGAATGGGSSGRGTVFTVNTDGTGFKTLHNFAGTDGAGPLATLVLSGGTLYGTTDYGGSSDVGTVFKVNTDGTSFRTLYYTTSYTGAYLNSGGAYPEGSLVLSGNTLYGTALLGGSSGSGTVFAVNTDGTSFTTLRNFTAQSDGGFPYAGVILSGNTLYGAASRGGASGDGTVFSLSLPLPQLTIVRSEANVILTWPASATGFVLQSANTLSNGGDWQDFPTPLIEINGQKVITVGMTNTAGFFRLRGP